MQKAVIERRSKPTVAQQSPKGSKGSLGLAEGGHTEVEGQFRALLQELEKGIGKKLPLDHVIISWIVRNTGWTLDKFQTHASDGLTTHRRQTGKEYLGEVYVVGEVVMF